VVGRQNTATTAKCTGEFRIEGIPVTGAPALFDVVGEALECVGIGISGSTVTFGEWFVDSNTTTSINPIPFDNLWVPPNPVSSQGAVVCDDINFAVPSMAVTAGTILTLSTSVMPTGQIIEKVSRPLVEISPRTAIPALSVSVVVHTNDDPNLNKPNVVCTVNGANLIIDPVYLTGFGPSPLFPGGFATTFTVPIGAIGALPAIVQVTATETGTGPLPRVRGTSVLRY
jgi:hypothetical protein